MQEIDQPLNEIQHPPVDSDGSLTKTATLDKSAADPISTIVIASRAYHQLMRAEKPLGNQIGAYWRMLERLTSKEEKEQKEKEFKRIIRKLNRTIPENGDELRFLAIGIGVDPIIFVIDAHRASLEKYRNEQSKILESAAQELAVWPWVESVRGIGALGLALIVGGAAAPLWPNYANPAKLWKRFGLAVLSDGKAQRRTSNKELAIEAGFNPTRRAVMHNMGESLMKQNKRGDGEPGKYRQMYLDRKEYEAGKMPDAKPIYCHKRALRYMEKKFIVDLWEEWKRVA